MFIYNFFWLTCFCVSADWTFGKNQNWNRKIVFLVCLSKLQDTLNSSLELKTLVYLEYTGFTKKNETIETTWNSLNMTIPSLIQVFCLEYSRLMSYLMHWCFSMLTKELNKFKSYILMVILYTTEPQHVC